MTSCRAEQYPKAWLQRARHQSHDIVLWSEGRKIAYRKQLINLRSLKEATKKEIDRRDISVPEIHGVGKYKVQIKLHSEVNAEINLEVTSY